MLSLTEAGQAKAGSRPRISVAVLCGCRRAFIGWGRWSDGRSGNGTLYTDNRGPHYVYGTPTIVFPTSGTATYGATAPTAADATHERGRSTARTSEYRSDRPTGSVSTPTSSSPTMQPMGSARQAEPPSGDVEPHDLRRTGGVRRLDQRHRDAGGGDQPCLRFWPVRHGSYHGLLFGPQAARFRHPGACAA